MRESLALTYSLNDRLVARDSVRKRACVAYRRINNSVRLSFVRDFEIGGLLRSLWFLSIIAAHGLTAPGWIAGMTDLVMPEFCMAFR